jgi:hypothetical protein
MQVYFCGALQFAIICSKNLMKLQFYVAFTAVFYVSLLYMGGEMQHFNQKEKKI